ncbi:MAG: hypothetical protein E6614_07625 [Bradyrhizobium sp.]|jgi:hypothetical protein|uniref:Uncharacterized protein n=1 Tax=Bradyrhizobium denitrificans TaxID=2734912 RepID=A0ABS5G8N4_9BRAD|nr:MULTISPECIES: hypothetical protein [Bradyrhizobium]MBR1137682.1 hypothetical protein [Bradyrhizobium denitrificans]MDU1494930.1 hypothetical protein [Bradyrhizobium sp.]MDU1545017.1 hypothetical protein [Bradyrhizobium sp.]MDU1667175.1 hypothetical protein [Bradyrhizobium sp.]MDU1695423.1 hypothetical protein [Bradyrhizobium sp.]
MLTRVGARGFPDGAAARFLRAVVGRGDRGHDRSGDLLPVLPLVPVVAAMLMISGLGSFG